MNTKIKMPVCLYFVSIKVRLVMKKSHRLIQIGTEFNPVAGAARGATLRRSAEGNCSLVWFVRRHTWNIGAAK